jgi:hypothetical protein
VPAQLMPVIIKFWQYFFPITGAIKVTDNAAFTFTQGSHSLLRCQYNQKVARYAADNKNVMVEILLAEKAVLKSPYVKR